MTYIPSDEIFSDVIITPLLDGQSVMRLAGDWSSGTAYTRGKVVRSAGSTYVCILEHTNQSPPNATYWTAI